MSTTRLPFQTRDPNKLISSGVQRHKQTGRIEYEFDSSSILAQTGGEKTNKMAMARQISGGSNGTKSTTGSYTAGSFNNNINNNTNNNNSAPTLRRLPSATEPNAQGDIIIEEKRRKVNGDGYTTHRYLRGRLLGKGGFAKVYMCTALDTNKNYAVKVVPKANLVKTRAKQKLQAEIKIHRTMKHDNICEYKHFFEDRTNCYILLELCHNQSMNEMIKRRKKLTEREAAYFMGQMTEAVQYMHDNCVIHRDLKLGNLFLDRDITIKVGDFGLATKMENPEDKRKTICGTPNYIAPEVIQGTKEERGHSFEVDIWSMGVILYTMVVGKPPYESKDVKATYKRIIANDYYFPAAAGISDEIKDLVASMLQSDPADRPKLHEIAAHPFLTNNIPESLPMSSLHIPPVWDDEKDRKDAISSVKKTPLTTRNVNVESNKRASFAEKRRDTLERQRSESRPALKSFPKPDSGRCFKIYDESTNQKAALPCDNASSSMQDLISKAATLTVSGCKRVEKTPLSSTKRSTTDGSEADTLSRMLTRLTTVLEIAEARKVYYSSAMPRPTTKGSPRLWLKRYVDYTSKYGLGFLLSDGSSGVYFNDSTKAILESEGSMFQYIERRRSEGKDGGARKTEPAVVTHTLTDYPDSLQKKVTLLKHFRDYLMNQQEKDQGEEAFSDQEQTVGEQLVYLKKWVSTKHAFLFRLSNQTVQIVFYDQTEVLLTPDERYVTYVDKKRTKSTFYLNDELVGSSPEIAKRLKYAKEILEQLQQQSSTKH